MKLNFCALKKASQNRVVNKYLSIKGGVVVKTAGGHLALCLGTLEESLVNAVIACNPITDLTDERWIKYAEDTKKAKEISPLYNIRTSSTPFLIMHGTADTCALPRHSVDFYMKMNGNCCDIKLIESAMLEAERFLTSIGFM